MALIFKFLVTLAGAWIAFYVIGNADFTWVLVVALLGTVLNYLIGDLFVLPKFGNIIASIGDGALGALTAYIVSQIVYGFEPTATSLAVFAVLVAVSEYLFHIYLRNSKKVAP
ncbi:hypothetical protein BET03_03970 [Thermohalobacter berrensis]|uniref:DUF2512 domain-containing protein n=2 Tax=Thermohalobacter berrensis TaxID=99594 RepID=A0A419SZJ3_9FIRM|nr:hypothetical protein BET03_03970 [Thermohalobacter berrensis]